MSKLNIEFMDDSINFYSKIEDDLESQVMDAIQNNNDINRQKDNLKFQPEVYGQLSEWRETLLEWYPFDSKATILEIGAGMGALTGQLLKRAKKVVCIEKKKSRCNIIQERFKQNKNIEIVNINIKDYITKNKFDYIIIHEMSGYIKKYYACQGAYQCFLQHMKSLLSENGKILWDIENKLGLKYFGGAIEEYSNKFFVGLNNYDGYDLIKTFTKNELTTMIYNAGFEHFKFYYPYPNNVFPTEIYTDEILNDIYYGGQYNEIDFDRFEFFNEQIMFRTLQREGIVSNFANTFLIEIGKKEVTDVVYYRINEKVEKGLQAILVTKEKNEKIYTNYMQDKIKNRGILPNCNRLDKYLIDMLDAIINDSSDAPQEMMISILAIFKLLIENLHLNLQNQTIINDVKFIELFGSSAEEYKTQKHVSVFVTLKDIYYDKDFYIISSCPIETAIPIDFVCWKLIQMWYDEYILGNKNYEKYIDLNFLYRNCDISIEQIVVFREWNLYYDKHIKNNVNKYYKNKYSGNFIYPVDAILNGDLKVDDILLTEENEKNMKDVLEEKILLDLLRK